MKKSKNKVKNDKQNAKGTSMEKEKTKSYA